MGGESDWENVVLQLRKRGSDGMSESGVPGGENGDGFQTGKIESRSDVKGKSHREVAGGREDIEGLREGR